MSRLIRIPAMVDPHVHLRGMEWAHKGDFATETASAVAGGYWAVFDMPNTLPSTVTRETLDRKLREISESAYAIGACTLARRMSRTGSRMTSRFITMPADSRCFATRRQAFC